MTLARLDEVLGEAVAAGRGVGAFNVIQLEHAEALVAAAEQTGLPVVLQISENAVRYHGSLAPIALATRTLAEASDGAVRAAPRPRGERAAGRRGHRARLHVGDVRRVAARRRGQPQRDPRRRAALPCGGRQRRGGAGRDRRQGRRARPRRTHRPGRCRAVRGGLRGRRAGGRRRFLARDDQPDGRARPGADRGDPRTGAGAAGAARRLRCPRRRPGRRRPGRDDAR